MADPGHHPIQISTRDGEVSIALSKGRSVFFRAPELKNLSYSQYDFALLAAFISSLTTGQRLYCDYPVTNVALRQFENYARALRILTPTKFKNPEIVCSAILDASTDDNISNKRILTLSGGIDSTYAASSIRLKDTSYTHALLIKGFDYPLDNTTGFADLRRRVENIANECGLELVVMETNLKDEVSSYGLQHTGALSCCLHLMSGAGFKGGGYAADFTAMEDVFRAPWGNCIGIASTLTTDNFPIDHLGNEVGRTEKIRWLAEHRPNLIPYISVCHRDKSIGGNCGKCEKCARTRIALAVIPDPQRRTEAELSLFGNTSEDHRDFFRLSAGEHKSTARLFDLSIALPDGEVRQLVNDAIDKVIAEQQRLQKITKPKRTRAQRVRSWAGRLKRKISKQAHGEQAS